MALTPKNEEAFLREVDEEVRKEQLGQFGRRYGVLIAILIVLGLVGFGGWLAWSRHQQSVAAEEGEAFTKALRDIGQNPKGPGLAKVRAIAEKGSDGYQAAAKLTVAGVASFEKNDKAAAANYAAIAADKDIPQAFRDLALIRQTTAQFDTLPPQQVVDRLKPLAQAGNPWFGSAGELVALAYMKMNKRDLAGPLFAAIARDETVPTTLRGRAQRMASALGVDMATPAPRATGGQ